MLNCSFAREVVLTQGICPLEQMQLGIRLVRYHQFIEALECFVMLMGLPKLFNIPRSLALLVICRNNIDDKQLEQKLM
jgi:hypothetical protein